LKVKNRPWKTGYKLASMFVTISVPMFIHSLSNQFLNISYANQYPSFNYLVVIGRFLVDNNLIKNAFFFDLLVFCIAMILVFIWYVYLSYRKKKIHSLH
jgi:ABC-type multidrug transport system permease subunit